MATAIATIETGYDMTSEPMLHWHLSGNIFPPVPERHMRSAIRLAQRAIEAANEGDWERRIRTPKGTRVSAGQIVEMFHLEDCVTSEFGDD